MCTAVSVSAKKHWFGRNLDYEHGFGERVVITPRAYPFRFKNGVVLTEHLAIIGMARPEDGYPLYFDGANEKGLCMAGLNFPEYARYMPRSDGKLNVAAYELIPWVLSRCSTVEEAGRELSGMNITDEAFSESLPPSPLHWLLADRSRSVVIEQTKCGLCVFDNPTGVLTNSPPFDVQMINLANFMSVSRDEPENTFSEKITLKPYSRGMGGIGLPGDLSSMSRFVRASFTKLNSEFGEQPEQELCQVFHILYSVYQQKGCVRIGDGFEKTNYTCCIDTENGIYYYTTYDNPTIEAIDMKKEDLSADTIKIYELNTDTHIIYRN